MRKISFFIRYWIGYAIWNHKVKQLESNLKNMSEGHEMAWRKVKELQRNKNEQP